MTIHMPFYFGKYRPVKYAGQSSKSQRIQGIPEIHSISNLNSLQIQCNYLLHNFFRGIFLELYL